MSRLKVVYSKIVLLFRNFIQLFLHKINKKLSFPAQIFILIVIGLSLILTLWPKQNYLSGYMEGEYVRSSLPFSGILKELKVVEGDRVQENDLLFKLDDREEKSQYDQSLGQLNEAEAQLKNILTGKRPEELNVIKADLEAAKAQVDLTRVIYERQKKLVETKVTSRENLDRAETEYTRAKAQVKQLEAQLSVANLPARPEEITAATAKIEAAKADVSRAQWRLEQKSGFALQKGVITNRLFQLGEFVPANTPVVELLPDRGIKAVFFVHNDLMARLTMGQDIFINTGYEKVACKITFISPTAEFTPPVIYSIERRDKLVFRIEARPENYNPRLHPGQPISIILP